MPGGRAGLTHATCHELRHTCFTRLREAGMALEAIQAQAGHASHRDTRIYLHLSNDWLPGSTSKAMEVIDDLSAADAGAPMTADRDGHWPIRPGRDHRPRYVVCGLRAAGGHGLREGDGPACAASPAVSASLDGWRARRSYSGWPWRRRGHVLRRLRSR